jgi:hypothetical protein
MFEQAVTASEATQSADWTLIPGLCGCPRCGGMELIAGPIIRSCDGCGETLTLIQSAERDAIATG